MPNREDLVPVGYDEFVSKESGEVSEAYRQRWSTAPSPSDLYHNAWRRLAELWTHRDIIHDILGEPLEDGGAGGASTTTPIPPVAGVPRVATSADKKVFLVNGVPTFLRGFSAFPLFDRMLKEGFNYDAPWAKWVKQWTDLGYNYARVFLYTPREFWGADAWDLPTVDQVQMCVGYLGSMFGLVVEVTLTTDARSDGYDIIQRYSDALSESQNVILEHINEPTAHDKLDSLLTPAYHAGGDRPWTNGDVTARWRGTYGTSHDPRGDDPEWPRKPKGNLERWTGGGPDATTDPACPVPWISDEPGKVEDNGTNWRDWEAFYGVCAQMCAGAVVHTTAGKFLKDLTEDESQLRGVAAQAFSMAQADGLFTASYIHNTNDEKAHGSLRTYEVQHTRVRVRPTDGAAIISFI